MKKFVLFILNVAIGLTLAIQVLIHPALDSSAKITFLLAAVIFINWAVFTWLAFSSAIKEKRFADAFFVFILGIVLPLLFDF